MTSFTQVSGIDMSGGFSGSRHTVMAGDTGIGNAGVIKRWHQPVSGQVANITSLCSRNVRCTLTDGNHTIMTGLTAADDFRMVHQRAYGNPCCTDMAGFAKITGINMVVPNGKSDAETDS